MQRATSVKVSLDAGGGGLLLSHQSSHLLPAERAALAPPTGAQRAYRAYLVASVSRARRLRRGTVPFFSWFSPEWPARRHRGLGGAAPAARRLAGAGCVRGRRRPAAWGGLRAAAL